MSTLVAAESIAPAPPKLLFAQIKRLTDLLSDEYAVGYPEAMLVQTLKLDAGDEIVLAVFTIEGFGGGNNHKQYLAVFSPAMKEKRKQHFTLIAVTPIAGKGWRAIRNLNARVSRNIKTGDMAIAIDALEVGADDAPNFPSKAVTINLSLQNGRLLEK